METVYYRMTLCDLTTWEEIHEQSGHISTNGLGDSLGRLIGESMEQAKRRYSSAELQQLAFDLVFSLAPLDFEQEQASRHLRPEAKRTERVHMGMDVLLERLRRFRSRH